MGLVTKEEVRQCRASFDEMDKDGRGELDRWEMRKALESIGRCPTDEQLQVLLAELGINPDAGITFEDFVRTLELQKLGDHMGDEEVTTDLLQAFVACGGARDGTGGVSIQRVADLLDSFGIKIRVHADAEQLRPERKGMLNFNEFAVLLNG